ncbi:hypothetical protein J2S40_001277 [Nocardioides luteus]|uniref:ABC transporter permease n=1 Tax=Nocardioides luteus TaxID=1844 RepID=A0ABQ5T3B0_9ACTN|nr:hypothetical protein [Nocardioides luteus]MDR7310219.1 hypothetical protein [Nocardioides luteus]GGR69641.1 hypothetical protein GCM10010197_41430 [Nocardioides luteus]GLJ70313.1 hypothetical protein GCM10017579_43490 [Nocardioides luteus]
MPKSSRAVIGVSLGLITLLTLLISAFAWPTSELEPRSLPLVVAGPEAAVTQIEAQLAARAGEDAFDVSTAADRDAAVEAIEDREAYGAIVAGPEGAEVLVASAASANVAQQLTQMATAMAAETGAPPTVTDAVASPEDDPRGIVFGASALPLVIGGIMVGAITSMALRRTRDRVAAAFLIAVGGGLAMTGVVQGWLGALEGSYLANAGVVALGILAVALPIVGLRHLIGPAGIGVVALLVLLVGNPLSGITSAPEMVPFGWLGQLMPPGAAGSALRGFAFFDGAATVTPLIVLACWAGVGLLLTLLPHRESGSEAASTPAERDLEDAAAV